MVCVYCGGKTNVVNSRSLKRNNGVWRRRRCLACSATVSTEELVIEERALRVDKNSHLEPFQRDKLFLSVFASLRHRKSALEDATGLTDTILRSVYAHAEHGTVKLGQLNSLTLGILKRFDSAAAVHYGAYHAVQD